MQREARDGVPRGAGEVRPGAIARFVIDPRPMDEQLAAFAERGAIAPESLSLAEIRMLCEDYVRVTRRRAQER